MAALEERPEILDEDEYIEAMYLASIQDKFFEPWDESDLVLVVEERKVHVHSLILKMASPVFKTMLSGNFMERDATEIVLPDKNVAHFILLLRQMYPQYSDEIDLYNCENMYKLADEYQIESVIETCLNLIETTEITKDNVFMMFKVSKLCKKDRVHKKCFKAIRHLTVSELKNADVDENLDQDELLSVLSSKASRLEKCLKRVLPEFVGLLDCVLYFWFEKGKDDASACIPNRCPAHYLHGKASKNATIEDRVKCGACRMMFLEMKFKLLTDMGEHDRYTYMYTDSGAHFDDIITSLKEMYDLLHGDVTGSP